MPAFARKRFSGKPRVHPVGDENRGRRPRFVEGTLLTERMMLSISQRCSTQRRVSTPPFLVEDFDGLFTVDF
ncbi:MAG: hypothetical protein A3G24_23970 [Betaproteobacteria bacterium RIFCSPLOWO2_12_FULL_62_13]|nr:MAG: hypothetical protein A3G24_23970 [Betaproteobacteria bacterium RIFCSPLOWO2_12_FULL_62_13]